MPLKALGKAGLLPFVDVPGPVDPHNDGQDEDATQTRPWEWSFLRWRKGEGPTLFWILLIHAAAVAGLLLFPVPGWKVMVSAWAVFFLGGIGTTVGYHRALAHKAVRLKKPAETVLTFLAISNGSGSPATWSANHRLHHAHADKERDISSPGLGGFWWSHLRWLWQAEQASLDRWAPDMSSGYYRFWMRWQWAILLGSLLVGLPFGAAAFFWMGPIRLVFALHAQCFVNSIAHMREGARPGQDSSQNIAWLGIVHSFQGENWHGNHHAQPWSAQIGWTWWQLDLGWATIRMLEMTGLAEKARRARPEMAPASHRKF